MRFILFGLITVLLSCASEPLPVANKQSEDPPFYRRYKIKEKELIYVVAKLTPNIDSPTKMVIEKAIKRFAPEIILIKYRAEAKIEMDKDFSACENGGNCSTPIWTCVTAKRRGIPCQTAEPYHTEIARNAIRINGGTMEEILFFYTYRLLLLEQEFRKDKLKDEEIESKIELSKTQLNIGNPFSTHEFKRMYKDRMNASSYVLNPQNILPDARGNYLQRLSHAVETSYSELTFSRIQKEHASHKRIMVVYGPVVFYLHEKLLEETYSGHIP